MSSQAKVQRVRLLPIVVAAMVGLLGLKLLGMVLNGNYIIPSVPPSSASAPKENSGLSKGIARVVTERRGHVFEDGDITGAVGDKKKDPEAERADAAKADLKKSAETAAETIGAQRFNPPASDPRAGDAGGAVLSEAERKVLERLRQRRADLESRDQELEVREGLLRATERKLDERIGELRQLEGKLDVGETAKKQKENEQLKALVIMYEAMKPKDAARVFDRLDTPILMDLVPLMNPRKTSEVLAAMSSESAQRLTLALARRAKGFDIEQQQAVAPVPTLPESELPRIDRAPAPRP